MMSNQFADGEQQSDFATPLASNSFMSGEQEMNGGLAFAIGLQAKQGVSEDAPPQKNSTFVITLNGEGIIVNWNKLAEETLEITAEEAVGKRLSHLGLNWNIEHVHDLITESQEKFEPYQCEMQVGVHEKTRIVRLNVCATPDSEFVQIMGFDITEPRLQRLDHKAQIEAIGRSHAVAEFDLNGSLITANDNFLEMTGYSIEEIRGKHHSIFCELEVLENSRYLDFWKQLNRGEFETGEYRRYGKEGKPIWIHATYNPILDIRNKPIKVVKFALDLTKEREAAEKVAMVTRQAELSEIANGVIHNIGNVLNSINTSAHLLEKTVKSSRCGVLSKAASMIWDNKDNLADFFTKDVKGKHFPQLIHEVATALGKEHIAIGDELKHLVERVDHVKEIINMQQSFALMNGTTEYQSIVHLMESSLKMLEMMQADIRVDRHFENVPKIKTKKHKVLQIFVNLLSNAKHALHDLESSKKLLTVSIFCDKEYINVEVKDCGVGIPAENLEKIFSHGFTTKKRGHGFGLHSSINAAEELGGHLSAKSDGIGRGATFILKLPLERENS